VVQQHLADLVVLVVQSHPVVLVVLVDQHHQLIQSDPAVLVDLLHLAVLAVQ
jgi:hypothetical protein